MCLKIMSRLRPLALETWLATCSSQECTLKRKGKLKVNWQWEAYFRSHWTWTGLHRSCPIRWAKEDLQTVPSRIMHHRLDCLQGCHGHHQLQHVFWALQQRCKAWEAHRSFEESEKDADSWSILRPSLEPWQTRWKDAQSVPPANSDVNSPENDQKRHLRLSSVLRGWGRGDDPINAFRWSRAK